jgi:hypothetical protein
VAGSGKLDIGRSTGQLSLDGTDPEEDPDAATVTGELELKEADRCTWEISQLF